MAIIREFPVLYKRTSKDGDQVWRIWVETGKKGAGVICTEFGLIDGKKQVIREEIRLGKNRGRSNETTPLLQAELEARARWEKMKSRKGYGLTAEESAAVRRISPMLAQSYDKYRGKIDWSGALGQPKLNGFRCLIRNVGGKLLAFSRENQPLKVPHIVKALGDRLGEGEALDGELYLHGMSLNQIASACKRLSDLTEQLQYHVYDTVYPESYPDRYEHLHSLVGGVDDNVVLLVKSVKVRSESDLMVVQREFIEQGYEGAMLRHGQAGYEAGKRSASLLKVKTFHDDEFEVVDYKMGRGKYEGVPVFTCVTAEGHHFDVLAPGDMEAKKALGETAAACVGMKLTVKYLEYTRTAEPVPFHPVALQFRD